MHAYITLGCWNYYSLSRSLLGRGADYYSILHATQGSALEYIMAQHGAGSCRDGTFCVLFDLNPVQHGLTVLEVASPLSDSTFGCLSFESSQSLSPSTMDWFKWRCGESHFKVVSPGAAREEEREPTTLLKSSVAIWPSWTEERECWWCLPLLASWRSMRKREMRMAVILSMSHERSCGKLIARHSSLGRWGHTVR